MEIKELTKLLNEAISEEIQKEYDRLLEEDSDEYLLGYDEDYVDVGVGGRGVCVRCDEIYDEERAYSDAKFNVSETFLETLQNPARDSKTAKLYDFIQKYIRDEEYR